MTTDGCNYRKCVHLRFDNPNFFFHSCYRVTTCCAVTMDPDDVEELIDKLMNILIKIKE